MNFITDEDGDRQFAPVVRELEIIMDKIKSPITFPMWEKAVRPVYELADNMTIAERRILARNLADVISG